MSEATRPAPYAEARVREPAGDRTLGESFCVGGVGADIVVPGTGAGRLLTIERRKGAWVAEPTSRVIRFDGRPLITARDLRQNDVLAVGDAQLVVADVSRTLLRLEVLHLVGNATIAPATTLAAISSGEGADEELEVRARDVPVISVARETGKSAMAWETPSARGPRRTTLWIAAGGLVLALAVVGFVSMAESVPLDILPSDARVKTPGTLLSWRSADRLWLLPGEHAVRAEREGYVPSQVDVNVAGGNTDGLRFRLIKLPGRLHVDTGAIAAVVSIDGAQSGRAPGDIDVPPGDRTITLRAPRYLDYISHMTIEGAGVRQNLTASLKPSWGTVGIATVPAGAQISVDGVPLGTSPRTLEVDSGVRRVEIATPGAKTWESTVVVRAGETLTIGPVTLGQPDATLALKSEPAGADVTVAGTHRGKTPLEVDLPAGAKHEVVVHLPGYASWSKSVFAKPGRRIGLDAKLSEVVAAVSVQGDPTDADLLIDGAGRGRTPLTMKLSAIEHRIDVRKEGFVAFTASVIPEAGLERRIQYHLVSANHAVALQESAPLVSTGTGYALRLVPIGTFVMGSDRREQGRRPNEGLRQVTLQRAFYLGATEITNGEFRKFRPTHASGFIDRHSLDLDAQPVSQVSWDDAAEYCNWLSERDALPPAYEKQDKGYVLKRPVTTGYRLPTEAEWEYAARYDAPGQFRRFAWGDSLPVQARAGNIAGAETASSLPASLAAYKDDYPVSSPVGKFEPTPLGLHDLSGNVSEWVNDYYFSFVDSLPVTDPLGPDDGTRHVVRGANWKSATTTELRLAWRDAEDHISPILGFRIARYAE